MTSNNAVHAVIFGHNDLPRVLWETVRGIAGEVPGVTVLSNQGISRAEMAGRLETVLAAIDGPTVIFADLFGGSCPMVCRPFLKQRPGLAVICGVNLPMLLEFVFARETMAFPELVRRLLEVGKDGIRAL